MTAERRDPSGIRKGGATVKIGIRGWAGLDNPGFGEGILARLHGDGGELVIQQDG
jgi:hypothetical protein